MAEGGAGAPKRREAIRAEGDLLALAALDRQREAAFQRGERRSRMPSLVSEPTAANPLFAPRNAIGPDAVNASSYLRDVGTGPHPSRFDPHGLGEVLAALKEAAGWNANLEVGQLSARWAQIVGQDVARNCPIESFEEGKLVLRASSTSWKTQINALLATLAQRIDAEVGAGVVLDIEVKGPPQRSFKRGRYSVPGRGPRDTYG